MGFGRLRGRMWDGAEAAGWRLRAAVASCGHVAWWVRPLAALIS